MINFKKITAVLLAAVTLNVGSAVSFSADAATLYGDVNGDGAVDIGDSVSFNKYLAGKLILSEERLRASDVNQDYSIDSIDRQILLSRLVSSISSLPYSMGTATESSSYTIAKPSARTYIGRNCTTGENTIYSTTGTSGLSTCDMVDNRVVDNSEDSSSIVQLSVGGTGFIVDKHIIATAAHCLYSKDSGFIDNIDVNIYADDGVTKLATFDAKEIHIPYQYKYRITNDVDDSDCYDYGLIYVEEDLSNYGIMGIGTISNEFLESKATLGLSGFPAEVNSTDVNCKIRYVSYGTSDQDTSSNYAKIYKIKLVASASGGDSGGPMFIEKEFLGKKYRTAVGIFTAGVDNNMYGTRITPTLVQFLRNSYVGTL